MILSTGGGGGCQLPSEVPGPKGGGSAPGGVPGHGGRCLVETPRDSYCCRRCASYWNALLWLLNSTNSRKTFRENSNVTANIKEVLH